jgi:hypothetical protein
LGYSLERKAAVLKRMLPPNNVAIRQLSGKMTTPRRRGWKISTPKYTE